MQRYIQTATMENVSASAEFTTHLNMEHIYEEIHNTNTHDIIQSDTQLIVLEHTFGDEDISGTLTIRPTLITLTTEDSDVTVELLESEVKKYISTLDSITQNTPKLNTSVNATITVTEPTPEFVSGENLNLNRNGNVTGRLFKNNKCYVDVYPHRIIVTVNSQDTIPNQLQHATKEINTNVFFNFQ